MVPQWVMELQTSDWLMFAFAALLLFFVLDYGTGTPWWKAPVSTFVFEYGFSVLALIGLIIYGVIFGQRVEEWARIPVMFGLCVGIIGKIVVLKVSRREGRIERRERRRLAHEVGVSSPQTLTPEGRAIMAPITSDLSVDEIKEVTTIWYKAQRVARTAIAALISALSVWAGFALVFPSVIAELAKVLPGPAIAWITAAVASISVVAGVITRIMAIPRVNAFLTKWLNLGSVPQSAIRQKPEDGEVIIVPDAKAIKNG